ncbi:MAG: stress response translation initiation inhibitor YciH [archaeon]
MEVCKKCGLPKDFCVCESISREAQKIIVRVEQRKFKKSVTLVEGINPRDVNLEDVTKKLKEKLACGGTARSGLIELQGDHRKRILPALIAAGFPESAIGIIGFGSK